jgi:radical SAM superfamily enzyme YgiQ (UPF0313 family)
MKIGLIDVDGHNFPNLPLMKLSSFHKNRGDVVEWCDDKKHYDIVYKSKVFDFTPDVLFEPKAEIIIKGGTGYGLENLLPHSVENETPDYSLYPKFQDTAYGFLTRGCPRSCPFCIVGGKEGTTSRKVSELKNFWNGQKNIKLLDPNLLACTDRDELLQQLINSRAWIDFTQGLDIRLMTSETEELILKMKIKAIYFSWDKENGSGLIIENLKKFKERSNFSYRKLRVYVLTNFDTQFAFDLERIYTLREMGYDPFVMVYDRETADMRYKYLQRWVNNKFVFRSTRRFEDYDPKLA